MFVFILQVLIYICLLFCLEKNLIQKLFHRLSSKFEKLPDLLRSNKYTIQEKEKVLNDSQNLTMKIKNISKQYNSFCGEKVLAVNQVINMIMHS